MRANLKEPGRHPAWGYLHNALWLRSGGDPSQYVPAPGYHDNLGLHILLGGFRIGENNKREALFIMRDRLGTIFKGWGEIREGDE